MMCELAGILILVVVVGFIYNTFFNDVDDV